MRLFTKVARETLGQYVVRGAVNMDNVSYDASSDTVSWQTSEKGFEFINQLATHLPPRRIQLVRRYGIYAGPSELQCEFIGFRVVRL